MKPEWRWAYDNGYAVWLINDAGGIKDLVAWASGIDVAYAQFDAAKVKYAGRVLSMRQRGRVVREVDKDGNEAR